MGNIIYFGNDREEKFGYITKKRVFWLNNNSNFDFDIFKWAIEKQFDFSPYSKLEGITSDEKKQEGIGYQGKVNGKDYSVSVLHERDSNKYFLTSTVKEKIEDKIIEFLDGELEKDTMALLSIFD
jgi:hypothetical protein